MITAIIVGAGHRSMMYASYAKNHPEEMKIVGVADPLKLRQEQVAAEYGLTPEQCFDTAEELASKGKLADVVINGTMDIDHVSTTLPLLEAGYDVLLEKPFAVSEEEVTVLDEAVKRTGRKVMICHVLRYAPFYTKIKEIINSGTIGELINIQTTEHVSYHHVAIGYVRGKWRRKDLGGSSTLMAKSCHDLDLITWFCSEVAPTKVSSFGGLRYFTKEKAPADSGQYCLLDCPIENECNYSARKHYLDHPERWGAYVWADLEHIESPSLEIKEEALKDKNNLYGQCVWKLDNDVVDRQTVMIEFANGITATMNMICGCSRPMRKVHIIGTEGEIHGILDDNQFVLRHIDPRAGCEYTEEQFDLNDEGDTSGAFGGHGGGDLRLVEDFVNMINDKPASISCTSLEDSINGHRIGFAADRAMAENTVVMF